jgi:hypothetical protein
VRFSYLPLIFLKEVPPLYNTEANKGIQKDKTQYAASQQHTNQMKQEISSSKFSATTKSDCHFRCTAATSNQQSQAE